MKTKKEYTGWSFFLNNRGETGGEGNPSPLEEAMADQLPETDPKPDEDPKLEDDPKPNEDPPPEENLVEIEGYKGKDRRSSRYSGDERRKEILEKRDNLDLDFDYGHGAGASKKVAIKEVKETLKWLQDNNQTIAAGLSMNKYSQQFPQFGKVINAIVKGSFGENNDFKADFVEKIIKAVEAKEEVIEDQKDEIDLEIDKINKILDDGEMDEDSPQAAALRSSMTSLKAMKAQLKTTSTQLDQVTKKFEGFETSQKNNLQKEKDSEHKGEVKRVAELFAEELRGLTDKDNKDGYKFVVEGESKDFDSLVRVEVRKAVANLNLKEGEGLKDEQFKKIISESAKASYNEIIKRREAIEQAYAIRKGEKKPEKKEEEVIPEAEEDMDMDSLTKAVEKMLPQT